MRVVGKIFGFIVVVLIGMPVLFAITWASGLTSAALSEGFFDNMSRQVIERMPALIETGYAAFQEPGALERPDDRQWAAALGQVEPPLPKLLERTGLYSWLTEEVARTVRAVGEAVQGERAAESVTIDMRPLKQALVHPELLEYLRQVLAKLPPCDAAQAQRWREHAFSRRMDGDERLPPCHPGLEVTDRAEAVISAHTAAIPDTIRVFGEGETPPFDVARTVHSVVWLLFLLPVLLIGGGSILGARDGRGILRWSGTATLVTALFSLLLAALASGWLLPYLPLHFQGDDAMFTGEAGQKLARDVLSLLGGFLDDMFSPVRTGSGVVGLVGAALLGGSFLVKRERKDKKDAS